MRRGLLMAMLVLLCVAIISLILNVFLFAGASVANYPLPTVH